MLLAVDTSTKQMGLALYDGDQVIGEMLWHSRHYHTVELEFDGNRVVFKDWWDPGHDPNRSSATVPEFLGGALLREIESELGTAVLEEALATVELLTTGGPGVAEPPE